MIYDLRWCWHLSKKYKMSFAMYYIAELLIIVSSLYFIVWSKRAIDFAISGHKSDMLHALYWSGGLMFLGIILKYISTKCNELGKMKMLRDLQNEVAKAQMYANWDAFRNWSTGDLQFRISKDCVEVVQMITQQLPTFTLTWIRLIASLGLLWIMDSRLALVILLVTPLLLVSKIFYKKFRKLNKDLKTQEGAFSHVINENLKFRMLIRTLGIEKERWGKISEAQEGILSLKSKLLSFSMLSQTIVKLTVSIGFIVAFVWGVVGLNAGTISFGTMTAFLQLVGRVQNPMLGLLGFFPSFVAFGVSLERVQEILFGELEMPLEPKEVFDIERLEISNLSFRYDDKFVLDDVTLTLKKGESTAILGTSGRGKTTLIRVLLSVILPQKGIVKLYDSDGIHELDASFRMNFGYVPQGDKLFSGTILENLRLGDERITSGQIDNALYNSCAEFVYDLPNGLDTIVGESGYGLSEGQAQRIAIARTLIRDNPIWLFDEVTSSLDHETSKRLIERLSIVGEKKIIVFVTHDLDLAECCNQIYYMH